jgi:hypothetical protein
MNDNRSRRACRRSAARDILAERDTGRDSRGEILAEDRGQHRGGYLHILPEGNIVHASELI